MHLVISPPHPTPCLCLCARVQLLSDRPGAVARPPPALPQPASSGPVTAASVGPADSGAAGSTGSGPLLPGGVQKLLALELEVVQLQQSLQIAQLEFETRSAQLYSLKQRAEEAEQRAQVRARGGGWRSLQACEAFCGCVCGGVWGHSTCSVRTACNSDPVTR